MGSGEFPDIESLLKKEEEVNFTPNLDDMKKDGGRINEDLHGRSSPKTRSAKGQKELPRRGRQKRAVSAYARNATRKYLKNSKLSEAGISSQKTDMEGSSNSDGNTDRWRVSIIVALIFGVFLSIGFWFSHKNSPSSQYFQEIVDSLNKEQLRPIHSDSTIWNAVDSLDNQVRHPDESSDK